MKSQETIIGYSKETRFPRMLNKLTIFKFLKNLTKNWKKFYRAVSFSLQPLRNIQRHMGHFWKTRFREVCYVYVMSGFEKHD